jgi:branched-chain amino acid transport system permease protein
MTELFAFSLSGLTVGFVYALVGMGFTVIYNSSGIINFAQGEFVMAGGMVMVFVLAAGIPTAPAFALAVLVTALLGVALWKLIDLSRESSQVSLIILTLGYAIFLRGLTEVVLDKELHTLPSFVGDGAFEIMGAVLSYQAVLIILVSIAIVVALWLFFRKTRTGKAMIAVSNNPESARLMGINVRTVLMLNFAISASIAAVGGILLTPIASTNYEVGIMLGLKGFAAAIIGGLSNPFGAVLGGLILGLIEALVAGYLSSEYKDAVAFIIMLLILFVRPGGIFSTLKAERV